MSMRVPMSDFSAEYDALGHSLIKKIEAFFGDGSYILGPSVLAFEREFARYLGVGNAVGVGNGLEAIHIALMGLGIGKGDEVITVSNSDVATALAIVYSGAIPVFVDVDEYYHIDVTKVEQAITPKTKAILPVHLFGQVADMPALQHIAKKHHLTLVEDACQAHGATFRGKCAGTFGEAGCFSFYPTKNLGAAGDAGAIVTNNQALAMRVSMLRNRGSSVRAIHPIRGINSRLDEIQAVILLHKLRRLDAWNRSRQRIARLYTSFLNDLPQVTLPLARAKAVHVYHQFVIEASERDALQTYLGRQGIATLVHYPLPIHKQKSFSEYNRISLPKTEQLARRILSLPIHPYVTDEKAEYVSDRIRRFYRRKR